MDSCFTKMSQEWELLKQEVQGVRRENKTLSDQVAVLSKQHNKRIRHLEKECAGIRAENVQLTDDVEDLKSKNSALVSELAETKRLLNREMRKSQERDENVEGLKRIFNQVLISAEDRKEQLNQLKTEVESLRRQSSPSAPGATTHSQSSNQPIGTAGPSSLKMTTTGATAAPSFTGMTTNQQEPEDGQTFQISDESQGDGQCLGASAMPETDSDKDDGNDSDESDDSNDSYEKLRQNYWVPRKQATGPKKIDEVHKDFAQEQMRNQYLASQSALAPRIDNSQAGSRRGSRQRQDENKMGEYGWNTVGNPKSFRIDASKMKISTKSVVDDNIQLGPGGGAHKPIWSRGSHGGTQQPQQSQDDRPALGNRFSALTSDDSRRQFPRSPSRGEGSAGRGLRQGQTAGHGRGKIMSRSSQEGERRDAIANTRSFMGGRSQNSSRDNSWNRDDRRQFMGPRSSWDRDNPMTRSDSAVRTEEFKTPAPPALP